MIKFTLAALINRAYELSVLLVTQVAKFQAWPHSSFQERKYQWRCYSSKQIALFRTNIQVIAYLFASKTYWMLGSSRLTDTSKYLLFSNFFLTAFSWRLDAVIGSSATFSAMRSMHVVNSYSQKPVYSTKIFGYEESNEERWICEKRWANSNNVKVTVGIFESDHLQSLGVPVPSHPLGLGCQDCWGRE